MMLLDCGMLFEKCVLFLSKDPQAWELGRLTCLRKQQH